MPVLRKKVPEPCPEVCDARRRCSRASSVLPSFAGAGAVAAPAAWVLGSLTFVAGFFPALGSALAGISNQGEFARLARRSRGMHQRFSEILDEVRAFERHLGPSSTGTCAPGASRKLSALASETARLMVNEVLDWRIVFLDRPLREP